MNKPQNDLLAKKVWKNDLVKENEITQDNYPNLMNLSAAFFYEFAPRPILPKPPEYIYIPLSSEPTIDLDVFMSQWNTAWESAQIRLDLFEEDLPNNLEWLKKYKNENIYLIPNYGTKYYAYSSLFHLLPVRLLKKYNFPLLRDGHWPHNLRKWYYDSCMPSDFEHRLSHAFAQHLWPLINSSGTLNKYSDSDPLKILAHNLDFWLPYANQVIEDILRTFPRVDFESTKQKNLIEKAKKTLPSDLIIDRPLKGGTIWQGEEEAWKITKDIFEKADSNGHLRSIIDAVRSNRIEDDFSSQWSYEREDFERKLYKKRSKIKVSFVELSDTLPVHGPESEVYENLMWEDFLALLDTKERRIVVLLRNGITKVGEVSKILGYANHSPISKALSKIREKALLLLD